MITLFSYIANFFLITVPMFIFGLLLRDLTKLSKWLYRKALKRFRYYKNKPKTSNSITVKNSVFLKDYLAKFSTINREAVKSYFDNIDIRYVLVDLKSKSRKAQQLKTGHMLLSPIIIDSIISYQKNHFTNFHSLQ